MIRLVFALSVFFLASANVVEAKRVALVVGNAAYEHVPELTNPRNDADAVAASLDRLGFEVIQGNDLSRSEFELKVRQFGQAIRGADIALLYYAGHGLQVDGKNYLVPTNSQLLDETDLDFETIQLNTIISQMERMSRTNLVFLDACRNNPLARNLARSMGTRSALIGHGLAPVESGIGSLITFATQPGNVALDGEGKHSPFTKAFIRHIETPDEDIAVVLRRVRKEVIENTDGKQVPWGNSSLTGSVVLNPSGVNLADDDSDNTNEASVEIAYWDSIKARTSTVYFEQYLNRYPNGKFADIAEIRILELREAKAANEQDNDTQITRIGKPSSAVKKQASPEYDRDLVASIQRELNQAGCSVGLADGIWGDKTKRGLKNFVEESGIQLTSLNPSARLLRAIKGVGKKVCKVQTNRLDGRWIVSVVTTTPELCGWDANKFQVTLTDGNVTGGGGSRYWDGQVSSDGNLRMRRHFFYEGRNMFNILTGRISGDKGSGRMQHGQGNCRGKFTMARQ